MFLKIYDLESKAEMYINLNLIASIQKTWFGEVPCYLFYSYDLKNNYYVSEKDFKKLERLGYNIIERSIK